MNNLQNDIIIKHRRKSMKTIVIYKMGISFVDFLTYQYKNSLQNTHKIVPIEENRYEKIVL